MYVRVNMLLNWSDEVNLVEYRFNDTPFIIGTILASEPIRGRFYSGKILHEYNGGFIRMKPEVEELVSKWHDIFISLADQYGLSAQEKLSIAEESEYLMPVFSERNFIFVCTRLEMKQIVHKIELFLKSADSLKTKMPEDFLEQLKSALGEFVCKMKGAQMQSPLPVPDEGARDISLLAWRERKDEWGETYCTTYPASFRFLDLSAQDCLVSYEFSFIRENDNFVTKFHIPDIIRSSKFAEAWCEDLNSLVQMGCYPQGMLINVCERGTLDEFIKQYNAARRLNGYQLYNEKTSQAINTWSRYSNRAFIEGRATEDVVDELSNLL
ncbi:hypothetical protein IKW75_00945 [Candidatus Saccharibacteria bacterium]|nr:hypothetical protein [Candidatus Saccharibacteria bacterium]